MRVPRLPLLLLVPLLVVLPSRAASETGGSAPDGHTVVVASAALVRSAPVRPDVRDAVEEVAPSAPEPEPEADAPRAEGPELYPMDRTFSPLTARVVANLRAVRAAVPDRDDRVFAKVGDSMTVARAYVRCFGTDEVDLAEHDDVATTLAWFRGGRIGRTDPFRRVSLAAGVGWSTHHVLGGRGSALNRELVQTRARFATLMFGTNELESNAPRRYARRMWRIVDDLYTAGVVPIMSTLPGRGDRRAADALVPRYNQIVRGIAQGRGVPLLDIGRALERLDRRGLARDGVHPNVWVRRGRARPCELHDEALAFGHNLRNLLTLQMLDRLRRTVVDGEPAPDRTVAPRPGDGTGEDPVELDGAPFTVMRPWPEGARSVHHRLRLSSPTTLWLDAFARRGDRWVVEVRDGAGERLASRRGSVELRVPAGSLTVVLTSDDERSGDEYLLVALPEVAPDPY